MDRKTDNPPPAKQKARRAKPNARGEQSRQAILDAAERHFGEYGFRGASTAAIASEVDMSDPGLLHHFASKEGLLMALLNRRYSRDGEKLQAGMHLNSDDFFETLRRIIRENISQRSEVNLTMVLLAEALSTQHPAHEYFQMRYVLARTIMERHVRNLKSDGKLREALDPAAMASLVLAMFDGLQLQWLLDPAVDMQKAVETFCTLVRAVIRDD